MEIDYEVVERISTLSERKGITTELNLVSWDRKEAKFDIRKWDRRGDKERALKGIALSHEEAESLSDALNEYFSDGRN